MASARQIAANRRNAKKSTGPRTAEGRAAVRFNARKHGLAAEHAVIPLEDQADYTELLDSFCAEHLPATATEASLVGQMALALWRMRRAQRLESAAFHGRLFEYPLPSDAEDDCEASQFAYAMNERFNSLNPFGNLSRYEARLERAFYRALRELQRLRDRASSAPQPPPAAPPAPKPAGASSPRPASREPIFTKQTQSASPAGPASPEIINRQSSIGNHQITKWTISQSRSPP